MSITDEESGPLSIGAVLALLQADFPDISISKIRFLESVGLIGPARTPSGYRKFSRDDIATLRYILEQQTKHFLPLRVIREHLDAIDRGLTPAEAGGSAPRPAQLESIDIAPEATLPADDGIRMSRSEFLAEVGLTDRDLRQLESLGVVGPESGSEMYSTVSLQIARVVSELQEQGVDPRNLSPFLRTVDREVELVTNLVSPMRKSRDANERDRAQVKAAHVSMLSVQFQSAMVRARLAKEFASGRRMSR